MVTSKQQTNVIKQNPENIPSELQAFKMNMDSWVKFFNTKLREVTAISSQVKESADNANHNYELIKEIREEMDDMREEIKAIKLIQIMMLQRQVRVIHAPLQQLSPEDAASHPSSSSADML